MLTRTEESDAVRRVHTDAFSLAIVPLVTRPWCLFAADLDAPCPAAAAAVGTPGVDWAAAATPQPIPPAARSPAMTNRAVRRRRSQDGPPGGAALVGAEGQGGGCVPGGISGSGWVMWSMLPRRGHSRVRRRFGSGQEDARCSTSYGRAPRTPPGRLGSLRVRPIAGSTSRSRHRPVANPCRAALAVSTAVHS